MIRRRGREDGGLISGNDATQCNPHSHIQWASIPSLTLAVVDATQCNPHTQWASTPSLTLAVVDATQCNPHTQWASTSSLTLTLAVVTRLFDPVFVSYPVVLCLWVCGMFKCCMSSLLMQCQIANAVIRQTLHALIPLHICPKNGVHYWTA
jgi:hypothetical protein